MADLITMSTGTAKLGVFFQLPDDPLDPVWDLNLIPAEKDDIIKMGGDPDTCDIIFEDRENIRLYRQGAFRAEALERSLDPIFIDLGQGRSKLPLPLYPGVTTLFSPKAGGKTTLSEYIAAYMGTEYPDEGVDFIRYGEPEANSRPNRQHMAIPTIISERDMLMRLIQALLSPSRVVILDSFRQQIFASGGATGTGGVNLRVLTTVTQLSVLAERLGKTLIVCWNPQSGKEEVINEWLVQLESAVTSVANILLPASSADPLAKPADGNRVMQFVSRYHSGATKADRGILRLDFEIGNIIRYIEQSEIPESQLEMRSSDESNMTIAFQTIVPTRIFVKD
jgi:hypothetical protein